MYKHHLAHLLPKEFSEQIRLQLEKIEKEKVKVRTYNLEYKKHLRVEARDELIIEALRDILNNYRQIELPKVKITTSNNRQGLLLIGDQHYGTSFEIRGLHNEILNAYSPSIYLERMELLYLEVLETIKKEKLDVLHIFSLGDELDGILRVSQLQKLQNSLLQDTIDYSSYMVDWLNRLSNHVYIKFQMTYGNHTELRMLNCPKGTFEKENLAIIIENTIAVSLKENENFEFIKNPTNFIYADICGYNFFGIHGEVKNMDRALKDYSQIYNIKINYLIGAHYHHYKAEEIGFDCEVINCPAIIGIDGYSMSLQKTANPGAKMLIIEEGKGKRIEYYYKLN